VLGDEPLERLGGLVLDDVGERAGAEVRVMSMTACFCPSTVMP
jgi:hypothetical protein